MICICLQPLFTTSKVYLDPTIWIDQLPVSLLAQLVEHCTGHRFEFRTGLMFSTTSSVVLIAARIDSIKGS